MKASPRTSFVTQRPSRTFTTNQPSVAGARPPSVSSSRASSTTRRLRGGEPLGRSGAGPFGLDHAVLRRRGRHELVEQPLRRRSDFVDRAGESFRVRLRRLREAADLADVLQRGVADLLVRGGWLEVVERVDVSAHAYILRICVVTPGRWSRSPSPRSSGSPARSPRSSPWRRPRGGSGSLRLLRRSQ